MAWTQTDLDALETALKQGVRTVTFGDRTVTYQSISEMLRLREAMQQSLTAESSGSRTSYASFSRD